MIKIINYLKKSKYVILLSIVMVVVGYFTGIYLFSSPKEQLGWELAEDYKQLVNFYSGLREKNQNILEEDIDYIELMYFTDRASNNIETLDNLIEDYTRIEGERNIKTKLDELYYFTETYHNDFLSNIKINESKEEGIEIDFQGSEDLLKLFLEIAYDFEEVKNKYYEDDLMIIKPGECFWEDEKWYKVLTEMDNAVKENDFKERKKEIME